MYVAAAAILHHKNTERMKLVHTHEELLVSLLRRTRFKKKLNAPTLLLANIPPVASIPFFSVAKIMYDTGSEHENRSKEHSTGRHATAVVRPRDFCCLLCIVFNHEDTCDYPCNNRSYMIHIICGIPVLAAASLHS